MKKPLLFVMIASLVFSIQNAATLYVNSSYALRFLDDTTVGLLYTASAVVTLIGVHVLPLIITPQRAPRMLMLIIATTALAILGMSTTTTPWAFVGFFMWYFACTTLIYYSFDILIESMSDDGITGRIRGTYLTAVNFGYMIGPLAAGFLVKSYTYNGLYAAAALAMIAIVVLIALSPKTRLPDTTPIAHTREPLSAYFSFFKNHNLRGVFTINLLLQFFYAWMTIYMPLYLHETLGIEWNVIGGIFAGMLAAFVVCQYIAGRIADRIGEQEIMIFGLLLMGITTPIIFLTSSAIPLLLSVILFLTRVGASSLEVSSESYFFKHINAGQNRSLSVFRSTYPVAYIVAPLVASLFLERGHSIPVLFFILAGIMTVGALLPLTIKDTR